MLLTKFELAQRGALPDHAPLDPNSHSLIAQIIGAPAPSRASDEDVNPPSEYDILMPVQNLMNHFQLIHSSKRRTSMDLSGRPTTSGASGSPTALLRTLALDFCLF